MSRGHEKICIILMVMTTLQGLGSAHCSWSSTTWVHSCQVPLGVERSKRKEVQVRPSGWSLSSSPQPLWISCSKAEGRPLSLLRFRGKAEKCSAAASFMSNLRGEVSKFKDPGATCLHSTITSLL